MANKIHLSAILLFCVVLLSFLNCDSYAATRDNYEAMPPFISSGAPPLVMLVMGRNHKLYYEAYNDASDLNEDDTLDIRYSPDDIDYYGYFDSYKCYEYNTANSRFNPNSQTSDKTCSGADEWSGDFLNYLTMSRMDTMRKVLYGGFRSIDGDSSGDTVLERAYVPQDGHSWGKEYTSEAVDGYDIADYTPFTAPVDGSNLHHLFASTTLDADGDGDGSDEAPLLRYALNNTHRIWEWVAKEGPVADDSIVTVAGSHPGHPDNHDEYEALVTAYAETANVKTIVGFPYGVTNINGGGDYASNYLAIFTGTLNVISAGEYSIAVDGDDAVEVIIDGGTADEQVIGFYGAHGADYDTVHNETFDLSTGEHTLEFRIEEEGGDDRWYLYWNGPDSGNVWQIIPASATVGISDLTVSTYALETPASTIVNRVVRVKVCDTTVGLEGNCKQYPDGNYKPIGLLQRHGENDRMYFGLMTGSYENNMSGGVLRKNVSSIKDEVLTTTTGQFVADSTVNGIIHTINKMRIYQWNYNDGATGHYSGCGLIANRAMNEGECKDWGNPIAEMMYETQRYFAGKGVATSEYDYSGTTADSSLGLPKASWNDPYDTYARCSKPFMLVLSDINPSYDSDQLPGISADFGVGIADGLVGGAASLPALEVEGLANVISASEGVSGNTFIGQSADEYGGACTEKNISGFGDVRGLCPEEPSKGGGYYSASVALYGHENDLSDVADDQTVTTYAVGLASPLPKIEIPINGQTITLVPFGKSVAGCGLPFDRAEGAYQPANTIVDFFVESITPTSGTFRINYEDVEQGNDHDMDAIVRYEYVVNDDDTVTITLESTYAAGCIIQHMGYVISGTTQDGAYLEVRDADTSADSDPDYFLDTPPGQLPGGGWNDSAELPWEASRTFTPSATSAAQLLDTPLWYAAKWGAFDDKDNDGTPENEDGTDKEWDKDGDGIPDTYYYVTNPLRLEQQLNRTFASILNQASSGTAASVISNTRSGEGAIYQSVFFPSKTDADGKTISWAGQVHGFLMDAYGNMRENTNNEITENKQLDLIADYFILFNEDGTANRYVDGDGNQLLEYTSPCPTQDDGSCFDSFVDTVNLDELNYLWSSQDWLNSSGLDANISTQRSVSGTNYLSDINKRYIFTWIDTNANSVVDSSEVKDFAWPSSDPTVDELDDTDTIYPYLTLYPSFLDTPPAISSLSSSDFDAFLVAQAERQINFIRGKDYVDTEGNPEPLSIDGSDIPGTEIRARQYDGSTWRLGDITYSTPTLVGRPAENFHLLYKDTSYAPFVSKYKNRRQMIYAGANDGMVHAFNGGFYNTADKGFYREYDPSSSPYYDNSGGPILGAEMWAYVPYNLLPHLYWLTQTSYDEEKHVYYVDQKPRIFDAKIFPEESQCRTSGTLDISDQDCIHPNGWGTVMVIGMRFGGGSIVADMDKRDGATIPGVNDRTMSSAFMIFDITNPEEPPTLLAELTMPRMGFATSYPTVLVMADGDHDGSYEDYNDGDPASGENRWFLAFGSGPADSSGNPGTVDAVTGVYDDTVLDNAKSMQPGQFYLLDLVKLVSENELWTLNSSGVLTSGLTNYAAYDINTFISDPVTVDYDLDYNADALYFGTVSGDVANWGGKLRRIVVDDLFDGDEDQNPANWASNILLDAGQPITAAPTIAQDDDGKNWVFFGTGRYITSSDKVDTSQQSYYGLKEPLNITNHKAWATLVAADDLIDVTDFEVYTDQSVSGSTDTTWADMIDTQSTEDGWYLDFSTGERNLGQAALIGGLLSFTTFTPADDICSSGGTSDLWGLYYKSGSAFYRGVFGTEEVDGEDKERSLKKLTLGQGLATSPNVHVGREEGSTVFVQSSTGEITRIEEINPLSTKSGMQSWKLE